MEAHLGADVRHRSGQKVGRAHPVLECSEDVFDRLSSQRHGVELSVQSLLHPVQNVFVFPSSDAALLAGRALLADSAFGAGA